MFRIEKKILKNDLKYQGNIIVTYEIQYLQVISDFYDTKKFNILQVQKAFSLEKYAKETLFADAKKQYDYNMANGYPIMIYELIFTTIVTLEQDSILSFYQDEYLYTGGAHGTTTRTSETWNLEYQQLLTLDDIFSHVPYYLLYLLREINQQIEKNKVNYFDNYCTLVLNTFQPYQFYLTPHSVILYFQQYDIAPYSTGIPTFEISY